MKGEHDDRSIRMDRIRHSDQPERERCGVALNFGVVMGEAGSLTSQEARTLDADEERIGRTALDALTRKHEKVLASIVRLTEAIKKLGVCHATD